MNYIFKGSLRGYFCDECWEYLPGFAVRIYRAGLREQDNLRMVAAAKETFHELKEEEVMAKRDLLIAEAQTNERGEFEFVLSAEKGYDGGAFDIDFTCGTVPRKPPRRGRDYPPLHFHITTLQPQWHNAQDYIGAAGAVYKWEYNIPKKWWCAIRQRFGAYVICGRVVSKVDNSKGFPGLKVSAFDVDWLEDDPLGSAITDASGHFRIDYNQEDFEVTLLSPWLNIEWPAGPDLYFKVQDTVSGNFYIDEPRSRGHAKDRENAPNCFCIRFELDPGNTPDNPGGIVVPALFTHVGIYDIITGISNVTGLASDSNVFTRTIPLRGMLPGANASNAMEYRFRIRNLVTGTWLTQGQVVNVIRPTVIGTIIRHFPHDPTVWDSTPLAGYYRLFPFYIKNAGATYNVDPDADGWIRVPRNVNMDDPGGLFQAGFTDLANIDTEALTGTNTFDLGDAEPQPDPVALTGGNNWHFAGNPIQASDKFAGPEHQYEIYFEARKVGSAVIDYNNTLQRITMWNSDGGFKQVRHNTWAGETVNLKGVCMLDIEELMGTGNGCNKITTQVKLRYSCYHPYIDSVSLHVKGPGGTLLSTGKPLNLPNEASGNHVLSLAGEANCAYIVKLGVSYRLTSGWGRLTDAGDTDEMAFCKAEPGV